jgi:hypothetical protein
MKSEKWNGMGSSWKMFGGSQKIKAANSLPLMEIPRYFRASGLIKREKFMLASAATPIYTSRA